MKNIIKTVFVIIATLVGAGFASGKEIYSFFFIYGITGLIGICISSLLIGTVIYKVLKICSVSNIKNYSNFCEYIITNNIILKKIIMQSRMQDKISKWLSNVVNILLLITFFVMVSGSGSFLKQEFAINNYIGGIIIATLCYITFQKNVDGLIQLSNYLIPMVITLVLLVSVKNLNVVDNYSNISEILTKESVLQAIFKAILYGSYNCILLVPVLTTLRGYLKNKNQVIWISVLSFILITILSLSIYNILMLGNTKIFSLEMPIIEIVKRYGRVYQYCYLFMIGVSIYTTAISMGCGFLNGVSKDKKSFQKNSVIMCIFSIFISQISFSTFVDLLYPILGFVGGLELILLLLPSHVTD